MPWLVLGASLLIGGILLLRWFAHADVKKALKAIRWVGIFLAALIGVFLLVSGRFSWLWVLGMFLLPWISRLRVLRNLAQAARGPRSGNQSNVDTRFVSMTLDHDTGDMDGEIREGPQAGRRLSELSLEELLSLYRLARDADAQSASVLESYLDRCHGDAWRTQEDAPSAARSDGRMTTEEAYRVLNLEPGASVEDINKSHRDLMKKLHPDHGGSDYLAAKLNEAKELLLGGKR